MSHAKSVQNAYTPPAPAHQRAIVEISQLKSKFEKMVGEANTSVVFSKELLYASTAIMNNDYLAGICIQNPLSLKSAFQQVAACGLTLNPSRSLAYLVPRDGAVVLDISYRGMIRMAVEDGAILDCIVELVYSDDTFRYRGKRKSPDHEFDPFAKKEDRGEFRGVYVEVTLPGGRLLVEAISAEDIYQAREASELWKRKKKGPWKDHFGPMAKKAAIKIARKYWPQGSRKLDEAIAYLNDHGEGFSNSDLPTHVVARHVGQADVNEPEQTLDTTCDPMVTAEVGTKEQEAAEDAEFVEVQDQAEAAKQPEAVEETGDALPEKVIKKTAVLVERATDQGCWQAALDYVSNWPAEAARYATRQLRAAQYAEAAG